MIRGRITEWFRLLVHLGCGVRTRVWVCMFRVICWVLVKGVNLGYHNKEAIPLTIDPHFGNLN